MRATPIVQERGILTNLLISIAPILLLAGLWLWMFRRQQGAMGGGLLGGAPRKPVDPEAVRVTFEDVAGIDEVEAEINEVVDFLRDPGKYRRVGARAPKGVLLAGAPGTGKTLLARATAGEAKVPFFSASASEFIEMIVGVGASRVRELFAEARKVAPSIIFIDEIDTIGRARGGARSFGGHDEREQTLNQILTEMDGFSGHEGVVVLAATNRADVLDPALLRPGRFDRTIMVHPPDQKGRLEILRVHSRGVPLAEDVRLEDLASSTPGMTGADLANLVNEAALLAARRARAEVGPGRLHRRAGEGPARRGAQRRDSGVRPAAHRVPRGGPRAARHAAARRRPGAQGRRSSRGGAPSASRCPPRTAIATDTTPPTCAAGSSARWAEWPPSRRSSGSSRPARRATSRWSPAWRARWSAGGACRTASGACRCCRRKAIRAWRAPRTRCWTVVDEEVRRITDECYVEARRLLREHRDKLDAIVAQLLVKETLDEPDVYAAAGIAKHEPLGLPDATSASPCGEQAGASGQAPGSGL